jgi:hypothetical protein
MTPVVVRAQAWRPFAERPTKEAVLAMGTGTFDKAGKVDWPREPSLPFPQQYTTVLAMPQVNSAPAASAENLRAPETGMGPVEFHEPFPSCPSPSYPQQ